MIETVLNTISKGNRTVFKRLLRTNKHVWGWYW